MQDTNVKEYYDQKAAVLRLTASLEQELFDLYEEIDLEEQKDTPNDYVIGLLYEEVERIKLELYGSV